MRADNRFGVKRQARKTNKGEVEEHLFCHVTKRAVNNADGQCCELRWYQSHKWHGFMLAARRDAASHTGRSFASSCNVGSPNGHVVTQQTCLAYCPGIVTFSSVFCFRVERVLRFHDTLVIFDRDLSPFRQPRANG